MNMSLKVKVGRAEFQLKWEEERENKNRAFSGLCFFWATLFLWKSQSSVKWTKTVVVIKET